MYLYQSLSFYRPLHQHAPSSPGYRTTSYGLESNADPTARRVSSFCRSYDLSTCNFLHVPYHHLHIACVPLLEGGVGQLFVSNLTYIISTATFLLPQPLKFLINQATHNH
jgi:hypothetical protein